MLAVPMLRSEPDVAMKHRRNRRMVVESKIRWQQNVGSAPLQRPLSPHFLYLDHHVPIPVCLCLFCILYVDSVIPRSCRGPWHELPDQGFLAHVVSETPRHGDARTCPLRNVRWCFSHPGQNEKREVWAYSK